MKISWSPLLLFCLFAACSTPYQRLAMTGGYREKQLRHNEFELLVTVNGYTDWDKMIDYALLRAAEVSLENGYSFYMLIDRMSRQAISIESFARNRKTPGTEMKGTWVQPIVRMFRQRPVFGEEFYYDAQAQFSAIAKKLEIKELQDRKFPKGIAGQLPVDISGQIYYLNDNLSLIDTTDAKNLKFYDEQENLADRAVFVGHFIDAEMPFQDSKTLETALRLNIAERRINAVKIISKKNFQLQPHFVGYRRYPVADQFIAQFFVKPPYHLGLKFEPRNLVGHEYTVRGYYEPRAADYILAGDKILKMDGVDVLDYEGLVHAWFRWKANSEVHIELMRAGKILKVKMPVFPNEI